MEKKEASKETSAKKSPPKKNQETREQQFGKRVWMCCFDHHPSPLSYLIWIPVRFIEIHADPDKRCSRGHGVCGVSFKGTFRRKSAKFELKNSEISGSQQEILPDETLKVEIFQIFLPSLRKNLFLEMRLPSKTVPLVHFALLKQALPKTRKNGQWRLPRKSGKTP